MTDIAAKRPRPLRTARLETKVAPRLYDAVDEYAISKGYTLSSALYRILLDWEKNERRKAKRQQKNL